MNTVCLIIAAIFFGIGALLPLVTGGKTLDWLCAGLCMVDIAYLVGH